MENFTGENQQTESTETEQQAEAQARMIAMTDNLLAHKREDSPLTYVDMILHGDPKEMVAAMQGGPLGDLLTKEDDQLALPSDGSYYPRLDVFKRNLEPLGASLRAWGWDYDDTGKIRQLDIDVVYGNAEHRVVETLTLYACEARPYGIRVSSQLWMQDYAETGYEGHGGRSKDTTNSNGVTWFINFASKYLGDMPMSHQEKVDQDLKVFREKATQHKVIDYVDQLIAATWPVQALYLMNLPMQLLEGASIKDAIEAKLPQEDIRTALENVLETLRNPSSHS